jgi:hypothetical protein
MVRQFWIHLLDEDEADLCRAVDEASLGAVVLPGRFARGDDLQRLLTGDLSGFEFPQVSGRQVERLIVHPRASKTLVSHPVEEGPLKGAQSIDIALSDCLHLIRPQPNGDYLEPARLIAETHSMRAEKKLRKSPSFSVWVGVVLRALRARYRHGAVDFIHLGAKAEAWADSGKGTLSYLYQPVSTSPLRAEPTLVTTPQKR